MSQMERPDLDAVRELLRELLRAIVGWALVAAGAILLIVGWLGVSREALVARQLPYFLSGGLGGLAMVIVGAVLVASHDLNRFGRRLRRLEEQLNDLHDVLLVEPAGGGMSTNGAPPDEVAVLPGGERFHHVDCPVVEDKEAVEHVRRTEAEDRGLTACKLCLEDPVAEGSGQRRGGVPEAGS